MNKTKNKGITLVALVITIIILLILAGITISQLTGSGIFERAKEAKEKHEQAAQQEILDNYMNQIGGNGQGEQLPENTKDTEAGTQVALEDGWGTQTVKYVKTSNGAEVTELTKVSTVYAVSVGNGETVPIPYGFYYVGGTISSGVVISDNSRDRNKYAGVADVPAGVVYKEDGTAKRIIYNTDGSIKTNEFTEEEEKTAIVGNQFVWIPCTSSSYAKYNFGKYNASWESNTDNGEVTYIKKYGGFYIGRYEAGTSNITLSSGSDFSVGEASSSWQNGNFVSSYASGKITCKAGEIPYYHADYTTAQTMTRAMYDNNYVQSGLVTGTMWDVALNYFIAQDSTLDVTNSAWGNYNNTTLTNCKGRYITVDSSNGTTSNIAQNTDGARHYGIMTSGSTEDVKKCNIYDMAGNLWEWTEEIAYDLSNSYYMLRGGSFGGSYASSGYPVCYRLYNPASYTDTNCGFRPALFIK